MAVLTNEHSASDGDQFSTISASMASDRSSASARGGVQGIKGFMPLMDGTRITIPKDSLASTSGHWLIENEGVSPDIEIVPSVKDFDPESDRHLETAVAELLKRRSCCPHSSSATARLSSGRRRAARSLWQVGRRADAQLGVCRDPAAWCNTTRAAPGSLC